MQTCNPIENQMSAVGESRLLLIEGCASVLASIKPSSLQNHSRRMRSKAIVPEACKQVGNGGTATWILAGGILAVLVTGLRHVCVPEWATASCMFMPTLSKRWSPDRS